MERNHNSRMTNSADTDSTHDVSAVNRTQHHPSSHHQEPPPPPSDNDDSMMMLPFAIEAHAETSCIEKSAAIPDLASSLLSSTESNSAASVGLLDAAASLLLMQSDTANSASARQPLPVLTEEETPFLTGRPDDGMASTTLIVPPHCDADPRRVVTSSAIYNDPPLLHHHHHCYTAQLELPPTTSPQLLSRWIYDDPTQWSQWYVGFENIPLVVTRPGREACTARPLPRKGGVATVHYGRSSNDGTTCSWWWHIHFSSSSSQHFVRYEWRPDGVLHVELRLATSYCCCGWLASVWQSLVAYDEAPLAASLVRLRQCLLQQPSSTSYYNYTPPPPRLSSC